MMRVFFVCLLVISSLALSAQGVDEDLLRIKQRLDSVVYFQANLQLETDISFVHMPLKRALMKFEKGKPVDTDLFASVGPLSGCRGRLYG